MSNLLEYKGYHGTVEYSEEDDILCGRVVGIRGLIYYRGHSLKELRQDFEEGIDFYLLPHAENDITPDLDADVINITLSPESKQLLKTYSFNHNKPLNLIIEDAIKNYVSV